MEMEDRVKLLENKVSDLVGAINYLAKKVTTIESNLTDVQNDETELHKSLTILAAEMRVLLPKLESSIDYVNGVRGSDREKAGSRNSLADKDTNGPSGNNVNAGSKHGQANVSNQGNDKLLGSVSVSNETLPKVINPGLLGSIPSATVTGYWPPITVPSMINANNTPPPATMGYTNGISNGTLLAATPMNYLPPGVGVHPSYRGMLGGGQSGAVRVTPICYNMGVSSASVPGFGASPLLPMGNGFAAMNNFNLFSNNEAPSSVPASVVNGTDKLKETAKLKPKVLQSTTVNACSKNSKLCTKFCNAAVHKCDYGEHIGEPCPPCLQKVDKKFKCGHAINLHCFVVSTNESLLCPSCEVKSQLSTTSLNEWQQEVLENIRVVVNEFNFDNVDVCKRILVDIVKTHDELTQAVANIVCQKALMESGNSATPENFASMVSKVVNYFGIGGQKFKEEIKKMILQMFRTHMNLTCDVLVAKLVENKMCNVQSEQRKNVLFRFVQELYEWNILTVKDVRTRVLDPILETPSSESASLVADFLAATGSTIFQDINEMKGENAKQEFMIWFENYVAYLSDLSVQIDGRGSELMRQTVGEISESFRTGWKALQSEEIMNGVARKRSKAQIESPQPQDNGQPLSHSSFNSLSSSDETFCTAKTWANVTKSSLTSSLQSLSSGVKPSVPIGVTRKFFSDYMRLHKEKKKIRIPWLQNYFLDKDESYMGTFIRTLSHQLLELEDRNWIEQLGHMLALMIEANIVSAGRVAKSFHEGIMWNFIGQDNQFNSRVTNVSKVLVNAMIEASDNLSWLATVGATLHTNHLDRWKLFCQEVFSLIETRYKISRLRLLISQTETKDKEKISPEFNSYKLRVAAT